MRKHPLAAALAAALPFMSVGAQTVADTPTKSLAAPDTPSKSLGVVTVTGGAPTSLPTQIPTTIEGITREQIQQTINATDSQDALKYLPSLLVRKRYIGDYNHAVLSTRASGTGNSARSMVYADGILLSNYLGNGATFAPRWMMVTPQEIERVDVLYGPFSAAYPGNSVGAVVDYTTRMPRGFEAHGQMGFSSQPFSLYGTNQTLSGHQVSTSVGNKNGDWSWLLNASRTDSQGQPLGFATRLVSQGVAGNAGTPVTGAVAGQNRSNQDWLLLGSTTQYSTVQDHIKAKVAYDITATLRASYTLGWWHNTSQGRSVSYLRGPAGNPVYSGAVSVNGRAYTLGATDFNLSNEDQTHLMHGLSVKSNTKEEWDWEVAASVVDYAQDTLRAATTAQPGALAGGAGRIVDQQGTGWNTLAFKGIWRPQGVQGAHIVDFGLQRDAYQLRSIENATTNWINGSPGARNQAFRGNTRLTSLYAQDTWKLSARWKTVLGARLERWRASGGETSNATATVAQGSRSETHVSPKAALAFQATPEWLLKASTGRAVRMPTVSELYQGGISANGTLINNDPNLKPEKSWTTELSAERDLDGGGLLRLTAFFERTRDALYSQTNVTVSPNVTNIQNVDRINTRGLEVAYQGADVGQSLWGKGLEVASSLTYADSKITRNDKFPASVGKLQPRVPPWRATAVATWRPNAAWSYTLGARYSGKQFTTLDNADPNGFAYQGTSAYFTTDLRVRWQINQQFSAAFGIDNLSGQQVWNFHPYPQRTFHAQLQFSL
jgi:iron complex outermembrane recepter protein